MAKSSSEGGSAHTTLHQWIDAGKPSALVEKEVRRISGLELHPVSWKVSNVSPAVTHKGDQVGIRAFNRLKDILGEERNKNVMPLDGWRIKKAPETVTEAWESMPEAPPEDHVPPGAAPPPPTAGLFPTMGLGVQGAGPKHSEPGPIIV